MTARPGRGGDPCVRARLAALWIRKPDSCDLLRIAPVAMRIRMPGSRYPLRIAPVAISIRKPGSRYALRIALTAMRARKPGSRYSLRIAPVASRTAVSPALPSATRPARCTARKTRSASVYCPSLRWL